MVAVVDLLRRLPLDFLRDERVQRILEVLPVRELDPATWGIVFGALVLTLAVILWVFKGEMVVARVVWLGFFLFVGAAAYWGFKSFGPTFRPETNPSDTEPALVRTDTAGETVEGARSYRRSQGVFRREARDRRSRGADGGTRREPRGRRDDRETRSQPEEPDGSSDGTFERALDRASRTYQTFSGSGETKTASFSVPTEWAVLWQNSAHKNAFFTIYVLEDGKKLKSVGSHIGPSAGLSETFPPGTYSLHVHGTKSWTVKILEPS